MKEIEIYVVTAQKSKWLDHNDFYPMVYDSETAVCVIEKTVRD